MYFPNRLELSFRFVFAFPKAVSTNINQVVVLKLLMKGLQYSYNIIMCTFKDGVGLKNLLFNPRVLPADHGQELQNQLGRFRLPSTTLSAVEIT